MRKPDYFSVYVRLYFPQHHFLIIIIQALELYEDLADIKRVIVHTNVFPAEVRTDTC